MKKLISLSVLMVAFSGIAWSYCWVDSNCVMRCERRMSAGELGQGSYEICKNICTICQ